MNAMLDRFRRLGHPKLLVVGDLILDRYTWGNAERVSPEAPVMVLRADDEEIRLGGAACVAMLLKALEAEVTLAGVVGDDASGRALLKVCQDARIDASFVLIDRSRQTTVKERFMGRAANRHPQQILRVDREERRPLDESFVQSIVAAMKRSIDEFSVVLVSDYDKGVCTDSLITSAVDLGIVKNRSVLIDPARIADYRKYCRATLLAPNRIEAGMATGCSIRNADEAIAAARALQSKFGVSNILVKLDSEGMVAVRPGGQAERFPTRSREVYDVTGAGDMVLAMLGLGQAEGLAWDDTIRLANIAAGLEVEKHGAAAVVREEIERELMGAVSGLVEEKLLRLPELLAIVENHRRQGKTIVFTNGCFDLLHVGHVSFLQQAAKLGDVLIVGVNSDASIRRLKGSQRPFISQESRAAMLAALACVDHVIIFDEDTPHRLLHEIRPDILVKGGTYAPTEVVGHEVVEAYGGRVLVTDRIAGASTTGIVQRIRVAGDKSLAVGE